jgi:Na+/H+-dicarboxylate symporter
MNNRNRLTTYILIGLVLGIVVGYFANTSIADPPASPTRCRW